jgi:hypothetical protein
LSVQVKRELLLVLIKKKKTSLKGQSSEQQQYDKYALNFHVSGRQGHVAGIIPLDTLLNQHNSYNIYKAFICIQIYIQSLVLGETVS